MWQFLTIDLKKRKKSTLKSMANLPSKIAGNGNFICGKIPAGNGLQETAGKISKIRLNFWPQRDPAGNGSFFPHSRGKSKPREFSQSISVVRSKKLLSRNYYQNIYRENEFHTVEKREIHCHADFFRQIKLE